MADPAGGVQGSLLQLQESLSAADRCGAALASHQLIRGLGQECLLSAGPAVQGGYRRRQVPGGGMAGFWGAFRPRGWEVQGFGCGSSHFLELCVKSG